MPRIAGHLPSGLRPKNLHSNIFVDGPQDFKKPLAIFALPLVSARWSSTYHCYVPSLGLVPGDGRHQEPVHEALPPGRQLEDTTLTHSSQPRTFQFGNTKCLREIPESY